MKDPIMIVLILAGIVSTAIGATVQVEDMGYIEGLAIICTAMIVMLVAAGNNFNKERQFRSLDANKAIKKVIVLRKAREEVILNTEVQVGDMVLLSAGGSVPCDGVMVSSSDCFQCDEAVLTGESKAVVKSHDRPFLLGGTQVLQGEGLVLATSVGGNTSYGALMESLGDERAKTPLEVKLQFLVKVIGGIGLTVAVALFIFFLANWIVENKEEGYKENIGKLVSEFAVCLTIIVVAIPEGLPLAVTISLAYSMKKMYKENNFVRVLSACETMGNATTICSDKTGTLTQNKMKVVEVYPDVFSVVDECKSPIFGDVRPKENYVNALLEGIAVNNKVFEMDPSEWKNPNKPMYTGGNKTEVALFSWGIDLGMNYEILRKENHVLKAYVFDSVKKSCSVLVKSPTGKTSLYLKGAAEKVVAESVSRILNPNGEIEELTAESKKSLLNVIDEMVSRGLRCICLAFKEVEDQQYSDEEKTVVIDPSSDNLVFLAVAAMKDPLRPEVARSVQICQQSGIFVRMVTGDHPKTAQFIAKECGILPKDNRNSVCLTGDEFRVMEEKELELKLPNLRVLARSTPVDKEKLVKWFMNHKQTVAVTGDGANDALALKSANVGLAMGIQGTDVAKEASDIIILDDSFTSIVEAVKWGRSVYDNIRKFIQFQLTINVVALITSVLGSVLYREGFDVKNAPIPFTAVQLLWMNIIMDTAAALAYATEAPTENLFKRRPYRKDSQLISPTMWKSIAAQSILQVLTLILFIVTVDKKEFGYIIFDIDHTDFVLGPKILKTCIFNTFVWLQIFNALNARKINDEWNIFDRIHKNVWYGAIFSVIIVLQILIVCFSYQVGSVYPISATQWFICIGFGSISILVSQIVRLIPSKPDYGFVDLGKDFFVSDLEGENVVKSKSSVNEETALEKESIDPVSLV